ncbi:MAG TPA: glycosyltransferase [Caldimonas sp.]|nr:glycosyltransferase [Caldimonas sp.]
MTGPPLRSADGLGPHVVDATMFWSPTGGGVRRYLLAKDEGLLRRGWRHTIAAPGLVPEAGRAPLPGLPLPASGGYRLPLRRGAVARVLEGLGPDLIEAGDPYRVAWAALDAAQALGIPAVAYCHSNLEQMARLHTGRRFGDAAARLARRYTKHVYQHFALVLAPSLVMRGHLVDAGVERVACQPLGVDTRAFHPSRASSSWRVENGLAADARVLVYAGRFAPEKHLDVLADAVTRLGAPYVLVAIGAGPTPPAASARVRVLPFVAGVPALATALASADAFVHAGDQETFGLSALEAMACATPVVVRAAEGLAELVDGGGGIGVDRGDAASFAAAIEALFATDRVQLRGAARRRAEASDWDRVLPGLLAHYLRLLGRVATTGAADAAPSRPAAPLPVER